MSYYFKKSESINQGSIRIAISQIKAAKRALKTKNTTALDIHNTRKYFKKIRGLLRLIKVKLGKENFKTENLYFRDLARSFSQISDSDAAIDTIDYLAEQMPEIADKQDFLAIRNDLLFQSKELTSEANIIEITKKVRHELNLSIARVSQWQLKDKNWKCFKKGFYQSYLTGYLQFQTLSLESEDEFFHEWRKKVKELRYQITLCQNLSNGYLLRKIRLFRELASLLGNAQDLSVFCNILATRKFSKDTANLIELAHIQKVVNQTKALRLASRAYRLEPEIFLNQLELDIKKSLI